MAERADNESVMLWAAATTANAVKSVGKSFYEDATGGSIAAAGREGVKDVRDTMHQVFFGKGDGIGEPGAPLNPTQGEVASMRAKDEGSVHGPKEKQASPRLPSPSEIAAAATPNGQKPHDHSQMAAIDPEGWVDRLTKERENKGSDDATGQNERARGRSLPDEQREQDKSRGR